MPAVTHFELSHAIGESVPFLSHWHIRAFEGDGRTLYEVRDSSGTLVAGDITSLEHARLFALAPLVFHNFKLLEVEAVRALWHMVDSNQGTVDVKDVAEDFEGEFEKASPGAPEHAQWLMEVSALREAVGEQDFPPTGIPRQQGLFVN
ncbi:hypothetical protein [Hydrogenophaga sp. BPS33]|uniref:hypothetical protein n=1 Tax=Hydrogenophaga sp. BPS33 TaxID=2651974 RepID=UPI00131FABDD|nr:hypothetical protein [Hydrogenophaga sp. BPS33]QHE87214.1 hypothetical protein F9K07_21085 [Hydrogenophaga sp. BPS33]